MGWWFVAAGFAAQGDGRVVRDTVELPVAGATGLAVRDVVGSIEFMASAGPTLRVVVSTAEGDVTLKLVRKGDVFTVVTHGHQVEDLHLEVHVPTSFTSVGVGGVTGAVSVHGIEAALSVVGVTGAVDVDHGKSLRVQQSTGPLAVQELSGDLLVDTVTGAVSVSQCGGAVRLFEVGGPVAVHGAATLEVQGGSAVVQHDGVRGTVTVPRG